MCVCQCGTNIQIIPILFRLIISKLDWSLPSYPRYSSQEGWILGKEGFGRGEGVGGGGSQSWYHKNTDGTVFLCFKLMGIQVCYMPFLCLKDKYIVYVHIKELFIYSCKKAEEKNCLLIEAIGGPQDNRRTSERTDKVFCWCRIGSKNLAKQSDMKEIKWKNRWYCETKWMNQLKFCQDSKFGDCK